MDTIDYINKTNDGTFNVVVYYKRYNDDKYYVVIKNGGVATNDSVGKPRYKVITNIDGKQHVEVYDDLQQAFELLHKHKGLKQLDDDDQKYIRPIINKLLGSHIYFTNYISDKMVRQMSEVVNEIAHNPYGQDVAAIKSLVDRLNTRHPQLDDRVQYTAFIGDFDKLCNVVHKMFKQTDNPSVNKLKTTLNLYNSFLARY